MGAINAPRLTPAVCPSANVALIDHPRLYRQSISRYLSRVSGDGAYTARIMEQIASLFLERHRVTAREKAACSRERLISVPRRRRHYDVSAITMTIESNARR